MRKVASTSNRAHQSILNPTNFLILFISILLFTLFWVLWQDASEKSIDESTWSYIVFSIFVVTIPIVCTQSSCLIFLWNGVLKLNPTILILNLTLAIVVAACFEAPVVRRVIFSSLMTPTAIAGFSLLLPAIRYGENRFGKITLVYVTLFFTAFILPGFYVPPFYDGICGWVSNPPRDKPVRLSGLKLVRDDGKTIWFSHSIINPINFMWRQDQHSRDISGPELEKFRQLLAYYMKLYKMRYTILSEGRLPNQAIPGKFAYPGHNPYRTLNYSSYPPERIVEIVKVNEFYERGSNNLIKRSIWRVFDTKTGKIRKRSKYLHKNNL